jgi:hypothetical protein
MDLLGAVAGMGQELHFGASATTEQLASGTARRGAARCAEFAQQSGASLYAAMAQASVKGRAVVGTGDLTDLPGY